MIFQRGLLGLLSGLIVFLIAVAAFNPPAGMAGVTSAMLHLPAREAMLDTGLRPASGPFVVRSVKQLRQTFRQISFELEKVADGQHPVPRLFVTRLPSDLTAMREVSERKDVFFKSMLPLVLKVNEDLRAERSRLWTLHSQQRLGEKLDAIDRLWLHVMAERYKVKRGDIDALLDRVDVVPTSLVMAQAAEESGWGTSRFTREGNALFGQWTWDGKGIEPLRRDDGKTHKIRAFDSLLDSVQAYANNLNTHRAYRKLRHARATMRSTGDVVDGYTLAGYLTSYSERGPAYVATLRTIMSVNDLDRFDGAKLAGL